MFEEVTKYSFKCECGKEFEVNGYWYNQLVMHHYLDCKYVLHRLVHHQDRITRKNVRRILMDTLIWIPLVLLQIVCWPYEIVWRICCGCWEVKK